MLGELFDPQGEVLIHERLRPHWSQAGAIVFATFRTADSIPAEVLQRWDREKDEWLRRRGLLCGRHWSDAVDRLDERTRIQFHRDFDRCREDYLDGCQGRCLLRDPALSGIVADSLLHFDGERYRMGDFIVMPNHVHLMASFRDPEAMEAQFTSWMRYTASSIHKEIGERGSFWQREPFDHLVRSIEQYEYLRLYILENPQKAGLKNGEFHYRRGP